MLRSNLVSFLRQFGRNQLSRAKYGSQKRRQKQPWESTESLEVRQLLTGDFVFANAILNGAASDNPVESRDLAVDSAGNTVVASQFEILDSQDPEFRDVRGVVTKLNTSGTVAWERIFSSNMQSVDASSVAVDAQQNVYVAGSFSGVVDFDPGAGTITRDGGEGSNYLLKLNPAGNLIWVRQMIAGNSQIVVSPAGNVYVTGTFQGTYDFDNSAGVVELTSATPGSYVLKYSSGGTLTWARQFSSSGSISTGHSGDTLEIDSNENLYVSGLFQGTADLDPGSGVFNSVSPGVNKSFLSRLNSAGDLTWAIVQHETMLPKGIAVDVAGSVFVTGEFSGTVDANPGAANWPLISSGVRDIYLTKRDSSGGFVWSRRFGGTGGEFVGGVDVDGQGNPHLTGAFSGTVDFDPGPGLINKTSAGQYDPFVLKVTSVAGFGWVRTFAGASHAYSAGVVVDASGGITTTGVFEGLTDFDPGLATSSLNREQAVYVSRLSPDFLYQTTAAGADDFVLRKNGSNLELFHKGLNHVVESHPISQIRSVKITGQSSQADTLTIDMSFGGAFAIDNGITFDGGSGVSDKFQVLGVSGQSAVYRPSVSGIGLNDLLINNKSISFIGTEEVLITGVTTLAIQTQGSADKLSLSAGSGINNTPASKLTGDSSGGFLKPLTFHNVRDVVVDTGIMDAGTTGNDKVTISKLGLKAAGLKSLTIKTGIGDDTFTVNSTDFLLGDSGGAFSFEGGSGTDKLIAKGNTNWVLSNNSLYAGGGGMLQLNSVEMAELTGGASSNILDASMFNGNVTLNGLGGDDSLFAALRSSTLNGGDGDDLLSGGIESDVLNGGIGVDHFVLKGSDSADNLSLQKTSTGGVFRRRNRAAATLLETDQITSDGSMEVTIQALGGHDQITVDSLFTAVGTVDGGFGTDTCFAPRNWTKINC